MNKLYSHRLELKKNEIFICSHMHPYGQMVDMIINDLSSKLKNMERSRFNIIKVLCQVLLDHKDKLGELVKSEKNSKKAQNWPCIWKSKSYGAKTYFSDEYNVFKNKLGKNFDHFTTCQLVLEKIDNQQYKKWINYVRQKKDNLPADDPIKKEVLLESESSSDIDFLFEKKNPCVDPYEEFRL